MSSMLPAAPNSLVTSLSSPSPCSIPDHVVTQEPEGKIQLSLSECVGVQTTPLGVTTKEIPRLDSEGKRITLSYSRGIFHPPPQLDTLK